MIVLVVGGVAFVLFTFTFLSGRRFGPLALALVAGSVLSELWARSLSQTFNMTGLMIASVPIETMAAIVLVVAPPLLILPASPAYHQKAARIFGSALVALLAATLLLTGSMVLPVSGTGSTAYEYIKRNHTAIVTIGIAAALADMALTRHKKAPRPHDKH